MDGGRPGSAIVVGGANLDGWRVGAGIDAGASAAGAAFTRRRLLAAGGAGAATTTGVPTGHVLAAGVAYANPPGNPRLDSTSTGHDGGSQPHGKFQPFARARRLYDRVGFEELDDDALTVSLQSQPSQPT
jgi:hypothetical protein